VLIFGQWKPARILAAAFFFGFMKAISSSYSGIDFLRDLPISSYMYKMIPYVATLGVLIFSSRKSQAPKAAGIPYDKGLR
jgi:simple sugar transport system permease protein